MNFVFFGGIIGDTAKEFGVDGPHLIAQIINTGFVRISGAKKTYNAVLIICAIRCGPSTPNSFAVSPMIPPKKTSS